MREVVISRQDLGEKRCDDFIDGQTCVVCPSNALDSFLSIEPRTEKASIDE